MKILKRILTYVIITILIMFIFTFTISRYFSLNSVYKSEENSAYSDISRLSRHMIDEMSLLYNLSLDYSKWDETYNFVKTRNMEYIYSNFYYDISFDKHGVNFLFISDRDGNIIYERYNQNSTQDELYNKSIKRNFIPLLNSYIKNMKSDTIGIDFIDHIPVMLSIEKITKSENYGDYNGYFIVGKYINSEELNELSKKLSLNIVSILKTTSGENKIEKNPKTILGYTSLKSIFGNPSATFVIEIRRSFYLESIKNLKLFFMLYVIFVILIIYIFVYMFKKDILNRILSIQNIIEIITRTSNYSLRIPIKGNDEISVFARDLNKMLDNLQESNEKLRDSIDEIYNLAYYDQLTQLPNRQYSMKQIESLINKNIKFTVFLIDIDDFKSINDVYGHEFGDIIIKYISKKLKSYFNKNAFISRIGGDEFLLIFANLNGTYRIQNIINLLISIFEKPIHFKNDNLFVNSSIGIANYPKDANSIQSLLKNVEIAMYEAKKNKSKYSYFDPSMNEKAMTNMYMVNNLKNALEKREFIIYFQPIYDIKENKVTGSESLIRWKKDSKIIPPNQFIPFAKDLGLIVDIDNWVLKESCIQCKAWHDKGFRDFSVSVNTSFKQIINKRFVNLIENILKMLNLEPNSLVIEITEDEALEGIDRVADILNQIRKLGVKIAIDDFGTGYSSLNYISRLPVDLLKIDRSLINNLEDSKNLEIIKAISHLSNTLKITTIVEGVENEKQLEVLKQYGIDKIQGYLIGKPVSKEEFEEKFLKGC